MELFSMVTITTSMHLMKILVRDMYQKVAKLLLLLARVESTKFFYTNQGKYLYHGIMEGLSWVFLTLLAVCAALL